MNAVKHGSIPDISRRQLWRSAAACLFVASASSSRTRAEASKPLNVIVAGGHPGDPEYGCGGTAARYSALGHNVTLLYLNRGDITCPDSEEARASAPRVAEARKACSILQAKPLFAAQCDGHAIVDAAHYDAFRELLLAQSPDIVFTQWPVDNHRDHRATSSLTYDAWLSGGRKFALYFYEVSDGEDTARFVPDCYVDITATVEQKRRACYAHASQSPDRFYALQDQVAQFRGLESGYSRAEAFIHHPQSKTAFLP